MKTNFLIGIIIPALIVLGVFMLKGGPSPTKHSSGVSFSTVPIAATTSNTVVTNAEEYNRPPTEEELASGELIEFEYCGFTYYHRFEDIPKELRGLIKRVYFIAQQDAVINCEGKDHNPNKNHILTVWQNDPQYYAIPGGIQFSQEYLRKMNIHIEKNFFSFPGELNSVERIISKIDENKPVSGITSVEFCGVINYIRWDQYNVEKEKEVLKAIRSYSDHLEAKNECPLFPPIQKGIVRTIRIIDETENYTFRFDGLDNLTIDDQIKPSEVHIMHKDDSKERISE